jgi:hypothetical protein
MGPRLGSSFALKPFGPKVLVFFVSCLSSVRAGTHHLGGVCLLMLSLDHCLELSLPNYPDF